MVRFGLSIYLMIVSLAGPLLCPCSAPQFLSFFSAQKSGETADTTPSCPCCPKLPKLPSSPTRSLPEDEQQPKVPPTECPCQSHGHRAPLISARIQQNRQAADRLDSDLFHPALLWWTNFASSTLACGATDAASRPFFNPKDLLFVFHFLRC